MAKTFNDFIFDEDISIINEDDGMRVNTSEYDEIRDTIIRILIASGIPTETLKEQGFSEEEIKRASSGIITSNTTVQNS